MQSLRDYAIPSAKAFLRPDARGRSAIFLGALLLLMVEVIGFAAPGGGTSVAKLEFLEPPTNAIYSTRDEIPLVLRAFSSNDVFLTADVFADNVQIADTSFCCWLCPCALPQEGEPTILQIPVPRLESSPPGRVWQGWTNVPAGVHRLTARSVGRNGTVVLATPISITVIDRTLRIGVSPDRKVVLTIPEGSMVPGRYDLEASDDLQTWTRLGPFSPGNVAAFYWDDPPPSARERFYRSVYVPN